MSDPHAASSVSVVLGRCDEMRAECVVRIPGAGAAATISGALTGPRRGRDTTLPVTARLQSTGNAGVARAILTEPAYWTPDLPNLYRLEAVIESGAAPPRSIDRLVGLRRLGVRGRSLWLDAHRWVPRAVATKGVAGIDACKPVSLAALVVDPDEATLTRADELGVAVLALVSATATTAVAITDRIAGWTAHPAAVLAILPIHMPPAIVADVATCARDRKGTLLLAATVSGTAPPPAVIPPGIDCLVVALDAAETPHDAWRSDAGLPLVAWRRDASTLAAGRAPCDALQAALATWGTTGTSDVLPRDWAGYIVG
ncbi:MAG: hypothetical protein ACKOSQ_11025 [Planctomycetaceae bacterium]